MQNRICSGLASRMQRSSDKACLLRHVGVCGMRGKYEGVPCQLASGCV